MCGFCFVLSKLAFIWAIRILIQETGSGRKLTHVPCPYSFEAQILEKTKQNKTHLSFQRDPGK